VLVMAKAPVAGQVKTRLGAHVGDDVAAHLAAACVLDTLAVCREVFEDCHVALAGDLRAAVQHSALVEALAGWTVHPQRGNGFAERLANAHHDVASAAGAPVVQIGMDTPHVSGAELAAVAGLVGDGNDAVLGPAQDGGWWVLAVTDPALARPLAGVEMSTARTYVDTLAALRLVGATVATTAVLRDVDEAPDADHAASTAPGTLFAALWRSVREEVPR
jgi:glycosyltransferase A (GT-A) superfamily protein (DUF2064 family)